MCGLIGFTGNRQANPTIINQLLIANDKRGGHSTGYYDGEKFEKVLGRSLGLHQRVRQLKTNQFIGHTRFSTHGARTLPNQHPFKYGDVVGAHNGVVYNYLDVGKEFSCGETEVDSQMIFKVLNKTNCDFGTLGKFSGALATLFTVGDNYYTYRKTNPLWCGRDKNGDVYFSSLKDVLVNCKLNNIYQLKEGRLYVWNGNTVIDKIDIEHDPIASYNTDNRNWWEYSTPKKNKYGNYSRTLPMSSKGVYSGITDDFDNDIETCGWDDINEIDITDYELTETQDTKRLMERTDEEFNKYQLKLFGNDIN